MDFRLKAQVAMEFVMLIMLAFMIMVIFTSLARNSMVDLRVEEEYVYLKDVTHSVQAEIMIAKNVEDGYLRYFTIPLKLDGMDYNITISDGYLLSESRNHEYHLQIPSVIGNVYLGVNHIQKESGVVTLNG